jgi:hypothetical protein
MQINEMVLAAAVLATGCLSTPPYKPEDAVSFTETGTGAPGTTGGTVAGLGFALHFADGNGFHFPDTLTIDGDNVLGHDATSECFGQDELGFLIAPTSRISAHGGASPVMNRLEPVLRGPAVVKVALTWATQLTCNPDRKPSGTATFTVFPDGRIVRYDTIVDPSAASIAASTCSCGDMNQQFNVVTFWTFAGAAFQTLYAPDDNGVPLPLPPGRLIANYDTSCVAAPAHQVALAWRESMNTELSTSSTSIRFGHTLSDVGTSILASYSYENNSAIFIEHTTEMDRCAEANKRAEEYVTPSTLFVNQAPKMTLGRDGIYGGDDGSGVKPGLPVSGRVELTGPVKSSFAVWLRFPHAVDALRATLESATGAWYMPQRVDDTSWIVWFRSGITAGQTIAIEPR